ncbi:MAG: hypothetical protein Q7R93_03790 [bacterium]|nr:hypothetical protein [bacterium]
MDITLHGEPITATSTGYIDILTRAGEATLSVKIESNSGFIGYDRAENGKHVTRLKNHGNEAVAEHRRTVPIFQVDSGVIYATDPKGTIWILRVSSEGRVQIFTVSLTTQNSECFLVYWQLFDEPFFQKDGKGIVCPGVEAVWDPEIATLLGEIKNTLPDIATYKRPTPPTMEELVGLVGVVKWFTLRMGIGVVYTSKGEARIHWSQCPLSEDGLRYVKAGERIRFGKNIERTEGHKPNPQWQILDVTLLAA